MIIIQMFSQVNIYLEGCVNIMIDFSPLFETLKEKGLVISVLRGTLSSTTVTKINKNEMETSEYDLATIINICLFLEVPVEKVIRIIPRSDI